MENLLNKYFAGTLTGPEKEELLHRISKESELKEEFARLQNTWAVSGMIDMAENKDWIARKYEEIQQTIRRRKRKSLYLSALKYSAIAVLFICSWLIFKPAASPAGIPEDYTCIEAPKGQRVFLTLADGTKVWLNSRSRLTFSNDFNKTERTVELDGEGFFTVSKNAQKPFIVKTKQYDIEVTGTEFNVFAYSASPIFETDLVEGSVNIYNKEEESAPLPLSPKERGYVEKGKLHKSARLFDNCLHIQEGIYSFDNKSLGELAKRLELWYDVRFEFASPRIAEFSFAGKFRQADNIENVLNAIKETGKFKYRLKGKDLVEIY